MIDEDTIERIVDFHGHMCRGLATGIRAAEIALAEIGPHAGDEEVVAIVETDMCAIDAIQFLTGCTFGKGNLIHRDYGKNAYTFLRRSDGKAVRVVGRAQHATAKVPGWGPLMRKMQQGFATDDDRKEFAAMQREHSRAVLDAPIDELFDVREVQMEPPRVARGFVSIDCQSCGEATMETRIRRIDGQELCPPCFDGQLSGTRLIGAGIGRRPEPA